MNKITQDMRYKQVVIEYSFKHGVTNAAIRYKTSRQNIYRWRKKYDGTLRSLADRSHRPHSHPNQHTRVKIDGTIVFSFGHFHRFRKNGDTGLTTLGRVSFVIPPSFIFPYVCMVCNSSFLN
jgi:hypothetical protein